MVSNRTSSGVLGCTLVEAFRLGNISRYVSLYLVYQPVETMSKDKDVDCETRFGMMGVWIVIWLESWLGLQSESYRGNEILRPHGDKFTITSLITGCAGYFAFKGRRSLCDHYILLSQCYKRLHISHVRTSHHTWIDM